MKLSQSLNSALIALARDIEPALNGEGARVTLLGIQETIAGLLQTSRPREGVNARRK